MKNDILRIAVAFAGACLLAFGIGTLARLVYASPPPAKPGYDLPVGAKPAAGPDKKADAPQEPAQKSAPEPARQFAKDAPAAPENAAPQKAAPAAAPAPQASPAAAAVEPTAPAPSAARDSETNAAPAQQPAHQPALAPPAVVAAGRDPFAAGAPQAPSAPPAAAGPAAVAGAAEAGQALFGKACAVCHTADREGGAKVGPPLYGVVGRAKASVADYAYSEALKAVGGAWTPEALDGYIANPKTLAPGGKMAYAGEKDPAKRAALVAFLETLAPAAR